MTFEPCACGDPTDVRFDHTVYVCITAGFFDPEDWANIEMAAAAQRLIEEG